MSQTAAEHSAELRGAVAGEAGVVAHTAKEQAGEVARSARDETREVVDRTKHAVEQEARARTDELARSVRRIGDGMQALAEGRPEDAGPVAGYARNAAGRVNDVAQQLEARGYDGLVEDVSAFARRRPGIFLAGAGLLGFAAGRMLRSGGMSSSLRPTGSSSGLVTNGSTNAATGTPPLRSGGAPSSPMPISPAGDVR
jgi:hypothetical protein